MRGNEEKGQDGRDVSYNFKNNAHSARKVPYTAKNRNEVPFEFANLSDQCITQRRDPLFLTVSLNSARALSQNNPVSFVH